MMFESCLSFYFIRREYHFPKKHTYVDNQPLFSIISPTIAPILPKIMPCSFTLYEKPDL